MPYKFLTFISRLPDHRMCVCDRHVDQLLWFTVSKRFLNFLSVIHAFSIICFVSYASSTASHMRPLQHVTLRPLKHVTCIFYSMPHASSTACHMRPLQHVTCDLDSVSLAAYLVLTSLRRFIVKLLYHSQTCRI